MLVCKFGVAANRGNGDPEEAGSRRRTRLETPVAVPVFGEERRGLVSLALHRDDMLVPRDRADEGIVTETAEISGETLEIVLTHWLVGKGEHVMIEPRGAYFGDGFGR